MKAKHQNRLLPFIGSVRTLRTVLKTSSRKSLELGEVRRKLKMIEKEFIKAAEQKKSENAIAILLDKFTQDMISISKTVQKNCSNKETRGLSYRMLELYVEMDDDFDDGPPVSTRAHSGGGRGGRKPRPVHYRGSTHLILSSLVSENKGIECDIFRIPRQQVEAEVTKGEAKNRVPAKKKEAAKNRVTTKKKVAAKGRKKK